MGEIVNYSVKMEEEDKQELQRLINNSGQQAKDFMAGLVAAYKINKVKESNPDAKANIEALQYHTSRVNEIYYNLTSTIDDKIRQLQEQHQKELEDKNVELLSYNDELSVLNDEIKNMIIDKESTAKTIQEQVKNINELESSNKLLGDLNNQYKDKINTLNVIVDEYKQYKDDIVEVAKQLHEQKESTRQVNIQLSESKNQIESLTKQMHDLESKHNNDLKMKEDTLMLECGNRVLKLKQDHQEQLEKVRNEYNEKIKELLQIHQPSQEHKKETKQK